MPKKDSNFRREEILLCNKLVVFSKFPIVSRSDDNTVILRREKIDLHHGTWIDAQPTVFGATARKMWNSA